jgi:hypothetical protein
MEPISIQTWGKNEKIVVSAHDADAFGGFVAITVFGARDITTAYILIPEQLDTLIAALTEARRAIS